MDYTQPTDELVDPSSVSVIGVVNRLPLLTRNPKRKSPLLNQRNHHLQLSLLPRKKSFQPLRTNGWIVSTG